MSVPPDDAALILYAVGVAVTAVILQRRNDRRLQADPILLCDECRERRRGFLSTARLAQDAGVWGWVWPLSLMLAAATWPVTWPARWVRQAMGRLHTCNRA